jgi:hypothetical protein
MYLLAFHAFLRVGEITGRLPPQENCMTANNLNFICDDCNNPHSIKIKLDQYKHSSTSNIPTLLIQTNTNIELCPKTLGTHQLTEHGILTILVNSWTSD